MLKTFSARQEDQKNGFLIAQGPPGAGKRKTIAAFVALIRVALQEENNKDDKDLKAAARAPSNAAADDLARRIWSGIYRADDMAAG